MLNKACWKKQTKKAHQKNQQITKQTKPKTKNKAKQSKCVTDYLFYQRSHLLALS